MADEIAVTFIFPVFNEERRIKNLPAIIKYFRENIKFAFEILVVCNGCTDSTYNLGLILSKQFSELRILQTPIRGRGNALKLGFQNSFGNIIAVCAIDRAWHEHFYVNALQLMGSGKYDVILGPKSHPESIVQRPIIRLVMSFFVKYYIGLLFGHKVGDVNCVKVFNKKKCAFFADLGDYNYFSETEFFLRARDAELRFHMIPVIVSDNNIFSKVKFRSLVQFFI
ncbi:MAG: glycosyltransferase, partial [Betaproteobacteria bacterium]